MKLPEYLTESLESTLVHTKLKNLVESRMKLTESYKDIRKNTDPIKTENDFYTYLISRLPATYNVSYQVLEMLKGQPIKSMLDIGSGPGTSIYAGLEIFEGLEKLTLVERNKFFLDFSRNTLEKEFEHIPTSFIKTDLQSHTFDQNHDLAIMSYVLNELEESKKEEIINKIWNKANKFLVIIEPGTPKGFENIRKIRKLLLSLNANIVAPCTHLNTCPISDGDWCHFYKRIERNRMQKYLKTATESYEDEKYSYVIFSKDKITYTDKKRIIRFPKILKGHSDLQVCSNKGIENITISAKDSNYKKAKKLDWGDEL